MNKKKWVRLPPRVCFHLFLTQGGAKQWLFLKPILGVALGLKTVIDISQLLVFKPACALIMSFIDQPLDCVGPACLFIPELYKFFIDSNQDNIFQHPNFGFELFFIDACGQNVAEIPHRRVVLWRFLFIAAGAYRSRVPCGIF
ncbi:MAG: hypothetical protein ABR572_08000 [Cryomorphaceae bacterium]